MRRRALCASSPKKISLLVSEEPGVRSRRRKRGTGGLDARRGGWDLKRLRSTHTKGYSYRGDAFIQKISRRNAKKGGRERENRKRGLGITARLSAGFWGISIKREVEEREVFSRQTTGLAKIRAIGRKISQQQKKGRE